MAKYLLQMRGHTATDWEQKGLAVGCMAFVLACEFSIFSGSLIRCSQYFLGSLCSTKWSLKVSNAVGAVKVVTLVLYVTIFSITYASLDTYTTLQYQHHRSHCAWWPY